MGFDFLMDTAPVINSRSPPEGGNLTSTSTTGNAVITESNPSFMLIFHNITGTFSLNQTISYSGDGVTQNIFNLSGMTDGKMYVYSLSINSSFGTWTNTSNTTFIVRVPSGAATGGGGGGGGFQVVKETVNETIFERVCNFNKLCEPLRGEDFLNCGNEKAGIWNINGDCAPEVGALFCEAGQQCIWRFGLGWRILSIAMVISIIGLIIIASVEPKTFNKFKAKTKKTFSEVRF